MAELGGVSKAPDPGEPGGTEPPGWGGNRNLPTLEQDSTVRRAVSYFVLLLLLLVGAAVPLPLPWRSGPVLHWILETIAVLLALVTGALALVRYYSRRNGTFLLMGTGFLGTALLDFLHVVGPLGFSDRWTPFELVDLSSWTFTASATFLSVFLFVAWLAWGEDTPGLRGREVRERSVYVTGGVLTLVIFGTFFVLFPVNQAVYPDLLLPQPAELFPAFFFALTLAGHLSIGRWRTDRFEHWLVIALLLSVMAHGGFMAFSGTAFDPDFDLAHGLKLLGYAAVLVGLMSEISATSGQAEAVAEEAREASLALAWEIEVRRRAERVLQASEERLQDFLDNAHDLIYSIDLRGKFLYVNRAFLRAVGYTFDELGERSFFDLLHPSCKGRCIRDFDVLMEGGTLPDFEVEFLGKDQGVVRCRGSANARFQEGIPVAVRSILRNVSEEVRAQRELEAFEAKLRALVENTGDAIWSVDRSFRLITFNSGFSMALEARTGREPRTGDLLEACFPEPEAEWFRDRFRRALRGEAFSELRDEEIGGQTRSYEHFFNPIREPTGITGVAVFGRDVTARRRTQIALRVAKEEAEQANLAKSQFLANMSHELRTPLNSVIGFTNILLKNRAGRLTTQEIGYLERISANGRHLLDLINEVLDLAKIEAGKLELDTQEVELEPLIQETLAQMEGQVRDKPVVLREVVPGGASPLRTDPGRLRQILINLLGNSVKVTAEGEVVVEVVVQDDGRTPVAIQVRDTGIGIPQHRLRAIFEAFQQADGTTTRKYGGTGLGLTISRSLCQLLGYSLHVESEEGKGSVFTIDLAGGYSPEKSPERALIEEALQPIGPLRARSGGTRGADGLSPKVLVIGGDSPSRSRMIRRLEEFGCQVVAASSAADAIERAGSERPRVITLDLQTPGAEGWDALKALKEDPLVREIPVIVQTGPEGEVGESNLLGLLDLLSKPLEREELLRTVGRNLDRKRDRTVLVVEDDPDAQAIIRDHLKAAGLSVVVADGAEAGEAALAEGIPDAILLDILLPGMDGMRFLSRLREDPRHLGIPVIICTAKDLTREERKILQAQASAIVPKARGFEEDLGEVLDRILTLMEGS